MADKKDSPAGREIWLRGKPVVLDPSGTVYLPEADLLVVSDLHFEKGSHFAQKGIPLPPYDTRATLDRLEAVIGQYQPRSVLSLGDAFHDPYADRRMDEADCDRLTALIDQHDWIWVLGNHDPAPPARFAGRSAETIEISDLLFVHEPGEAPGWAMAGHLHPCSSIRAAQGRLRRRCFVTDGQRLILPAFGAFTGALNVLDTAYDGLFEGTPAVYALGSDRVYAVPGASLLPDGTSQEAPVLRRYKGSR